MIIQRFDNYWIRKFYKPGSEQHRTFSKGESDAIIFETISGTIIAIFNTSMNYDQACALYDEWKAVYGFC